MAPSAESDDTALQRRPFNQAVLRSAIGLVESLRDPDEVFKHVLGVCFPDWAFEVDEPAGIVFYLGVPLKQPPLEILTDLNADPEGGIFVKAIL